MYPITNNFQKHTKNHIVVQQLFLILRGLPYQHHLQGHTDHTNYVISGHLFTWLFPKYIYDKKKLSILKQFILLLSHKIY